MNNTDLTQYILYIAVFLLYTKWIFIFILFPLQCLYGLYKKNKNRLLYKILAIPYYIVEKIFRYGAGRFLIFNVSTLPSHHIRKYIYKALGANIASRVVFHFRTEIRSPFNLTIGKGSIIGDNALLDARNYLIIGENVNLSSNVSIYTEQHDYRDPLFECLKNRKMSVEIDNRAWIGSNVTILPGVHIGEGAVCCAGCVVTKDIEPFTVVAGIPAKKVGDRPKNIIYNFDGKVCRLY